MWKNIAHALIVSVWAGVVGLVAEGTAMAPVALAEPADGEDPGADGETPGWEEPSGPPEEIDSLGDRDKQSYQDYLNGASGGPVNVPRQAPSAPSRGGGVQRRGPQPPAASKGSCRGLAIRVGHICLTV